MLSKSIIKCSFSDSKFIVAKIIRNYVSKTRNLYETLGLTPHATQADIKAAYYKLSKAYHPDLNPNDTVAAEKFRAISEAYEVLGTYRLRKMYDKGIIHAAGSEFSHHSKASQKTQAYDVYDEVDDDDTTRFYKSRLRREHTGGKTNIYDFDEWTKAHYGETFKKQQELKTRQHYKATRDEKASVDKTSRNTVISLMVVGVCLAIIIEYLTRYFTLDVNKLDKKKKEGEE